MASVRHISSTVLPSAWPASICRSRRTICSGVYVLFFTVVLSGPHGPLGLPYHVDQLSGSRPGVRLFRAADSGTPLAAKEVEESAHFTQETHPWPTREA